MVFPWFSHENLWKSPIFHVDLRPRLPWDPQLRETCGPVPRSQPPQWKPGLWIIYIIQTKKKHLDIVTIDQISMYGWTIYMIWYHIYIYIWMQHNMLASIDPWSNSVTSCWLWHSWDNQNKRMSPTTQRETSLIPSAASSYCCHYGTTENMSTWMIPKYPKWTWEVQANS